MLKNKTTKNKFSDKREIKRELKRTLKKLHKQGVKIHPMGISIYVDAKNIFRTLASSFLIHKVCLVNGFALGKKDVSGKLDARCTVAEFFNISYREARLLESGFMNRNEEENVFWKMGKELRDEFIKEGVMKV